MLENWQTIASIGGVISLALFLIPGSLFYAIMQNYAFRSGRYNLSPLTKLFIASFISLLLLVLTVHLPNIPFLSKFHEMGTNLFRQINPSNIQQLDTDSSSDTISLIRSILILVEAAFISVFLATSLTLLMNFFRLIRERNLIDQYLHYPLIRFTERSARKVRHLTERWEWHWRHGRYLLSTFCIFREFVLVALINIIGLLLIAIFVTVIILYLIDFVFYTLGQLLNHPLHRSIHRWKKWKQLPIIEVKMKNGILYKGVLHCFEPKNRSEIESISLRNVISYIPKKDTLSLSPNNREEVYNFGHRQEFFTIPFSQIDNFNIWYFAGNAAQYNMWTSDSFKNNMRIALWYLRLELTNYWYKSDPFQAIKLPSIFDEIDDSKLTDCILEIARTVDQCIPKRGKSSTRMRKIWYHYLRQEILHRELPFPSELRQICRNILF